MTSSDRKVARELMLRLLRIENAHGISLRYRRLAEYAEELEGTLNRVAAALKMSAERLLAESEGSGE